MLRLPADAEENQRGHREPPGSSGDSDTGRNDRRGSPESERAAKMRTKDGYDYWEYDSYEIRQIVLTTEYQAVYAEEDKNGDCTLRAYPLDALGVATVSRHFLRRSITDRPAKKYQPGEEYQPPDITQDIVGLDLADGYFQVVQDANNFAGIARKGEDINQATGYLEYEYSKLLPKAEAAGLARPAEATGEGTGAVTPHP